MITSETALLDTNVIVYAADEDSPFHGASFSLRERGLAENVSLCICPQVLNEFFAIVTDPRRVRNPISQREALLEMEKYYQAESILKIYPGPDIIQRILDLLARYDVSKQEIFDLQLIATMLSNNVTRLYTYNHSDFTKFKEIEILIP
ncbi:MAG: PIN domain-containing protein [Deltaproteobacteria bacterium]|nr:PIN domain-containing protein [Deltaproteobacteria bacterium]MBM4321947.1 PIN domain-containing protein [Deltaproteobacteria bacterium]